MNHLAIPSALTAPSAKPGSPASPQFWLPQQSSTFAGHVDDLFYTLVWISAGIALAVMVTLAWFIAKYRAKSRTGSAGLPAAANQRPLHMWIWPGLVLVLGAAVFMAGFRGYLDLRTAPKDVVEVQVEGQRWKWRFTYPGGLVDDALHVPLQRPVRLLLSSADVLHSVYIPAFRVKADAVPGRFTELWFEAAKAGQFPLRCAEYCGTGHATMTTKVIVHPPGGYEAWLEKRQEEIDEMPPTELGKSLFDKQGCSACHSVDGSPKIAPTWKGLFGKTERLVDGSTVDVDEQYLIESIIAPSKKVVAGFDPTMPSYKGKLNDDELEALVEYIKSLK